MNKPTPEAIAFANILYRDAVRGRYIAAGSLTLMRRLFKI